MNLHLHAFRHLSIDLLALLVLVVQVLHPWMHPQEIIASDADDALICPMSHTVGDVQVDVSWMAVLTTLGGDMRVPRLQVGHTTFLHPLAPRPPPVMPS